MIKELTTQLQESIDRDINNLVIRDNLDENENENENDSEHGERAEKDENGNDREMDDDRERAERDDDGDGDGREIEIEGGVNKLLGFFENNDIFNLPNNIGQLEAVIEGGTKDFAKLLENQDFNRLIDEFGLPTGDELLAKLKQDEFEIEREITLANGDTFGIELEGGEGGFELNLIAENEKPRLPIVPPKDPIPDIGFTIIDFTFDENIPFVGGTNIKLGLAVKNTTKPGGIGRGFEGSLGGLLVLGVTTPQGNIYGGLVDAKLKLKLKPGTFQPENVKLSGGSGAILGKTEDKLGTYLENLPLPGIVKDFLRKAQELADTEINVTETTSYSLIGEAEADFSGLVPITKGGFGIRVERVGSARGTLQGGFLEFSYKVKGQVIAYPVPQIPQLEISATVKARLPGQQQVFGYQISGSLKEGIRTTPIFERPVLPSPDFNDLSQVDFPSGNTEFIEEIITVLEVFPQVTLDEFFKDPVFFIEQQSPELLVSGDKSVGESSTNNLESIDNLLGLGTVNNNSNLEFGESSTNNLESIDNLLGLGTVNNNSNLEFGESSTNNLEGLDNLLGLGTVNNNSNLEFGESSTNNLEGLDNLLGLGTVNNNSNLEFGGNSDSVISLENSFQNNKNSLDVVEPLLV